MGKVSRRERRKKRKKKKKEEKEREPLTWSEKYVRPPLALLLSSLPAVVCSQRPKPNLGGLC